ncbi:MAG: SRPBCC family protein [Gemmataceae bacterium]
MVSVQVPLAPARSASTGSAPAINVGQSERLFSAAGGVLLSLAGLRRADPLGLAIAAAGAALVYRGFTGHCSVYQALNVSTAEPRGKATAVPAGRGAKVSQSITIDRPPHELYAAWRKFEQLPRFMTHLVSVKEDGRRSHWVARGPVGTSVEWDAEIINEDRNRLIAWRSLPGSQVDTAGSVHFTPASAGRGTVVKVELKYDPPGGRIGSAIAWLVGEDACKQVAEDLQRFKQQMEAGQVAATAGSSRG